MTEQWQGFEQIRGWAADRNLVEGSVPQAQMLKLVEELGELAAAIAKGNPAGQIDGVGDAIVVLTILSAQLGFTVEEAIAHAWSEIKDRRGRMVDGIFVKEAPTLESAA
ncbi:MAG: MazG-like family protein [Cyanobium sp. 49614_E6]|jgi:NTP pyrophosphatase (non-canonical NTP hydrolase)|nr:MazG-like family protein [Cyanobium sp. 49614_E6]